MNQRVEVEKVAALNDEQNHKLQNLWNPRRGDAFYESGKEVILLVEAYSDEGIESAGGLFKKSESLPLLTIGQMIELHDPIGHTIFSFKKWITTDPYIYEISINGTTFYGDDMCDALWESVKKTFL